MKHFITLSLALMLYLTDFNYFTHGNNLNCELKKYLKESAKKTPDKKIKDCIYKGFKLYGKVKIVDNFPDIKVQVVENFPDLKVKIVQNFPDECGEWKFVDNFQDFKIQFVDNFPDIKIKFVENFPGMP
jgi:hypothetical protein